MQVSDYTALLSDRNWGDLNSDETVIVSYSLNSAIESYWYTYNSTAMINTFQSAASVGSIVEEAFDIWGAAGNIDFVRTWNDDANINIGLFDFGADPSTSGFSGYAFYPGSTSETNSIAGDIFIDATYKSDIGIWLHEIGHALGLEHPHEGPLTLAPGLDNTSQTVMSYNGQWQNDIGALDRQAIAELYKGEIIDPPTVQEPEVTTSTKTATQNEVLNGSPGQVLQHLRDYDGNYLGATSGWKLLGNADVQLDGDDEFVFVNNSLGRWATLGPDSNGVIDFDQHGAGGDTRVVGIYRDPLVESGVVQAGSDIDSARRLEKDFRHDNLKLVGALDVDHDGFQNLYFKTVDGTAYLNALMHDDGNVRYANYQNEAQMIEYLTSNGWGAETYDDWLVA